MALCAGRPLIAHALGLFSAAGIPASIAGARSDLSAFASVVSDIHPDCGPLSGVASALAATSRVWNLFLPVDLPLMPPSLLRCLVDRAELTGAAVTATRLNGRVQPFPVVLCRNAQPLVAERVASGLLACHAAWEGIAAAFGSSIEAVAVEYLAQCGQCSPPHALPAALWFRSANTPADLASIESWLQKTG
jgi:molybdopterin-guanine dinucleotide biosynthesis protein A